MKGDIRRLPVWAQDQIRAQNAEIETLKSKLAQARAIIEKEAGQSNVFISGHAMDPDTPLGLNQEVRFQFPKPDGRITERFVDIRHERDRRERDALVVQCDGTILVEPSATNSIRLILSRR
jgi:hypothetical protein